MSNWYLAYSSPRGQPPSAAPFAGNVGQVLVNPQFLEISGGYEFLNLMKHAQLPWTLGDNSGVLAVTDFDSNGYPTALRVGSVYTVVYIPLPASRPGNYVVTFDGDGTVNFLGNDVTGSGSPPQGRGVVANTSSGGSSIIKITSLGTVGVSNLKLFHEDDEGDLSAGMVSGNQFRQYMKQAQTPVFRDLNWLNGNFNHVTKWVDRKPLSYVSYAGDEYRVANYVGDDGITRLSIYAGTTTNSGNDYSITPNATYLANWGSGAPADKQHILLNFNADSTTNSANVTIDTGGASAPAAAVVHWTAHGLSVNDPVAFEFSNVPQPINIMGNYYVQNVIDANSFNISATRGGAALVLAGPGSGSSTTGHRSPTLNYNGTGPIPIRNPAGYAQDAGDIKVNYNTLTYDAGLNHWYNGGRESGLDSDVPVEAFVKMCAEIGAHPWFCSPPLACDPMSDWHTQLATYVKNNGPKWMVPRFECLNEPWNLATLAGTISVAKSNLNWASDFGLFNYGDVTNFVGKIASTIGQAVNAVYGGIPDGTKYHIIVNNRALSFVDDYYNASMYVGQSAAAQSGFIKSASKNWITHSSCNQYFNTGEDSNNFKSPGVFAAKNFGFAITVTAPSTINWSVSGGLSANPFPNGLQIAFTVSGAGVLPSGLSLATIYTVSSSTVSGLTGSFNINATFSGSGTTPYSCGSITDFFTAVSCWNANAGNPSAQQTVIDAHLDDPVYGFPVVLNNEITGFYQPMFTYVQTFINGQSGRGIRMCGYEGGASTLGDQLDTNGAFWTACMNTGTNLRKYVRDNYQGFIAAGGEHPALFQLSGKSPRDNDWSALIDIYQSPPSQEWLAISIDLNH